MYKLASFPAQDSGLGTRLSVNILGNGNFDHIPVWDGVQVEVSSPQGTYHCFNCL